MLPLTRKEEEVLRALYRLERAFVRDLIAALPGKKPAYTTVSTVIRKLEEKGYVDHEEFGPTYRYFPVLPREEWQQRDVDKVLAEHFDDSYKKLVTHFAETDQLSRKDLEDILAHIKKREEE